MTNRNLSTSIAQLLENREKERRKLEEYLLAFWFLASRYKHQTAIEANQFIKLLGLAFVVEIPVFPNEWRSKKFDRYSDEENNFLAFEETILQQIVDLREMEEIGLLSNEMRYLGLGSPRENRWYNFDSLTYLKCAVTGLDGNKDALEDMMQNHYISWKQIDEFFWCKRIYE